MILSSSKQQATVVRELTKLYELMCNIYGPNSRNVIIEENGRYIVTSDGVTVLKHYASEHRMTNTIIKLLLSSAQTVAAEVGDGTTTVTLFSLHLLLSHYKSPLDFKTMEAELALIIQELEAMRWYPDEPRLRQVIRTTVKDHSLSDTILDTVYAVGNNGTVAIDDSNGRETYTETTEGYIIDCDFSGNNYITSMFAKDNITSMEIANCKILVYNSLNFKNTDLLARMLSSAYPSPMFIFARNMSPECLNIISHARKQMLVIPVLGCSDETLEDICALSSVHAGSDSFCDTSNIADSPVITVTLRNVTLRTSAATTKLTSHISRLIAKLPAVDNDFEHTNLSRRIAALTAATGIINIGAETKLDALHKRVKVEDGIRAAQAAISHGVLQGGGGALIEIYYLDIAPSWADILKLQTEILFPSDPDKQRRCIKYDINPLDTFDAVVYSLRTALQNVRTIADVQTFIYTKALR